MEIGRNNVTRFLSKCEYTLKGLWKEAYTGRGINSGNTVLDDTTQEKIWVDDSKTVNRYYDHPQTDLLDGINLPTYQIKLTPYARTFYTEWLSNPNGCQYNILSADQILYGHLDIAKLRTALKRYVNEHVLLNSHIQANNGEPYLIKNSAICELDYSDKLVSEAELLAYVQKPFDLFKGPLYRFKLVRLSDDAYRIIIVFHHLVMDAISINAGLFDAISNYYNNPSYTAEYSIAAQVELLTMLEQMLSGNLAQHRESYKNFWQQQLTDVENINLNFLRAPT